MKTKLTELLGIEYPIIQGAMAWVSEAHLAAAVGNAGGAGVIATGGRQVSWLREQIRLAKELTDKPFGVNIMLMDPDVEEKIKIVCEEKVAFVTTGAGNPVPYIDTFHQNGIKVIPVVPSVKLAMRMEAKGADAIVIEGLEAGGHIGKITTMALMTQVIPEVNIPVVVAGGIADGRGMAAALLMGAAGIQMGTRFYASVECVAHQNAKQAIVDATELDSRITGTLHNHEVRMLRNPLSEKYIEDERNGVSEKDLITLVTGTSRKAPIDGDVEWGAVQAGQSLTTIKSVETCEMIIKTINKDAEAVLKAAPGLLG